MAHVFTEVINCGKIGKIALKTYCKHHSHTVHVYGTKADFEHIEDNDKIVFCDVTDRRILQAYKANHQGLPMLWAKIIKECGDNIVIHFDSDVLFKSPIIEEMVGLSGEYDLIGPRRNQKFHCDRLNVPHKTDTIATSLWGINSNKLSNWSYNELVGMCHTLVPPELNKNLLGPSIDYFDPVSYDILRNGGKMYHFDFEEVGAVNAEYSRENMFADMNREGIDIGSKYVHFAGVGSGMDVYLKKAKQEQSYAEFAVKRYAMFCKIFYDEDLGIDISEFKNTIANKESFLNELKD